MHGRLKLLIAICALVAGLTVGISSPQAFGQSTSSEIPDQGRNDGSTGESAPTFGTGNDGGSLDASVGTGSGSGAGSPGPASFGPACTWTPATIANTAGTPGGGTAEQVTNDDGELGWLRRCGDDVDFVWSAPVDPVDLIAPAFNRVRRQLPAPDPVINPAPDVGGIVNLGLWHSIADPGTTTARANLGNAWAEVTGTFTRLTIDPGDGTEAFSCDGLGEPYPEGSNNPDQGPCGNTYTRAAPADAPYAITYTTTYAITWRTSDGRSGTLDPHPTRTTIPYDVDEVQTIGTAK